MVGSRPICRQKLADFIWRSQIADVVHKKLAQPPQNQSIRQRIFLYKISCNDCFIDLFNIANSVCFCFISIRARQSPPLSYTHQIISLCHQSHYNTDNILGN